MRIALFCMLLSVSALGCKKDTPDSVPENQQKQPPPAEPVAPKPAPAPEKQALAETIQERAAKAYLAAWCFTKRQKRDGLQALLKQHGFQDMAELSRTFSAEASKDKKWAETVLASAVNLDCRPVPGESTPKSVEPTPIPPTKPGAVPEPAGKTTD